MPKNLYKNLEIKLYIFKLKLSPNLMNQKKVWDNIAPEWAEFSFICKYNIYCKK